MMSTQASPPTTATNPISCGPVIPEMTSSMAYPQFHASEPRPASAIRWRVSGILLRAHITSAWKLLT
jgi:hypothetical protein